MKSETRRKLISITKKRIVGDDYSHDINHTLRVLGLSEMIAKKEKADLDVVTPAALFHDLIVYPKNDPRAVLSDEESANEAGEILMGIKTYPKNKIKFVQKAIRQCSFSKGVQSDFLEGRILQDADRLEATGSISIMRTFFSSGQMKRPLYDPKDPFCKKRDPVSLKSGLDLFFSRLLKVEKMMHTKTAKQIAKRRTKILYIFLDELKTELGESKLD